MSVIINGSAGVTTNSGAVYDGIQRGAAITLTNQTAPEFTGIPSWVKRITVMFSGVSTNGTSPVIIQIGAGSITSSGYVSSSNYMTTSTANATSTSAFNLLPSAAMEAAQALVGNVIITNVTSNTWASSGVLGKTATTAGMLVSAGAVSLSGTLDRVRITTVNGTDQFDAGTINIIYE